MSLLNISIKYVTSKSNYLLSELKTSCSVSSVIGKSTRSLSYSSSWNSRNSGNVKIRVGWSQTWTSLIRLWFITGNYRWFKHRILIGFWLYRNSKSCG